ncbi:MAG: DNA-binding protein WhiA [Halanaerobiales bacterium]|nr:DNA-binding protein WhiA [Halanaerobiales bacterium]MCF8008379.1 DNA-binding protein WhiA [Halanaerobiales bacterium]
MSFTDDVKHELAHLELKDKKAHQAELSALIRMSGSILISNSKLAVKIGVYHGDVARRIYRYIKEEYKFESEIRVKKNNLTKRKKYELFIRPQKGIYDFLEKLGILDSSHNLLFKIIAWIKRRSIFRKAYLRGAFLAGGSVNRPKAEYHLEIRCEHQTHAEEIIELMKKFDLDPHLNDHKGKYVIYLKKYNDIVTMLNLMGSYNSLLKLESAQVFKDIKNKVNRRVNCETANLDKTVKAAMNQIEDIKLIEKEKGLDNITKSLREIALLRKENPYLSLKELGEILNPKLSKSGVYNRIRRLNKIASKIRSGKDGSSS